MKYKILVHCTKEHLDKAKYCHSNYINNETNQSVGDNCWIAVAVQDILPNVYVLPESIGYYEEGYMYNKKPIWSIALPTIASDNIKLFDRCASLKERMALEPFSFEIEFDQATLDIIMQCNGFSCMQQFEEAFKPIKHLEFSMC